MKINFIFCGTHNQRNEMIKTATITKGVSTEAVNFVHDIVNKEQTDKKGSDGNNK